MLLHTNEAVPSWGASGPLLHITPDCFTHSFPNAIHIPPEMVENQMFHSFTYLHGRSCNIF